MCLQFPHPSQAYIYRTPVCCACVQGTDCSALMWTSTGTWAWALRMRASLTLPRTACLHQLASLCPRSVYMPTCSPLCTAFVMLEASLSTHSQTWWRHHLVMGLKLDIHVCMYVSGKDVHPWKSIGHNVFSVIMPQSHFQASLAIKIKPTGVADVLALGDFFLLRLMICVVVSFSCKGRRPGNSAHKQTDICWACTHVCLGIYMSSDALQMLGHINDFRPMSGGCFLAWEAPGMVQGVCLMGARQLFSLKKIDSSWKKIKSQLKVSAECQKPCWCVKLGWYVDGSPLDVPGAQKIRQ